MKKYAEYWKRAIVNGKVHTAIKHEAVGGLGFNPIANEETLLGQYFWEWRDTQSWKRGGDKGAQDKKSRHT